MRHPVGGDLALFAGGDLGTWQRWRISRHLGSCASCRDEVASFEEARLVLRGEAEQMPPEVDWDRMAAEMKANIHLGLVAGACVSAESSKKRRTRGEKLSWRAAAALAMATLVILTGWFLNAPRRELARTQTEGYVLEATSAGIGFKENGRGMTLLHPAAGSVTYSVNAQGSMRARYVDSDTGQVTITNVYAE